MGKIHANSKLLLLKYLMITGAVAITAMALVILIIVMGLGESDSGYALGFAIEPAQLVLIGLLIFCSLAIAYFMGPNSVHAICEGQTGVFVGVKSLLACWTAPCIILALFSAMPDLSWGVLTSSVILAIAPALVLGPIVGFAMKKEIAK